MILFYLVVLNGITFCLYGIDKWKAKRKKFRISEATLITAAVFGGSLGALCGMYMFHHKTKHKKFTIGIPCILFIHIILWFMVCMWK